MTLKIAFSLFFLLNLTFGYKDPQCHDGRHVIVHLFEWKWIDIAKECENFLGPKGFCGVQVSPPNEHRAIWMPSYNPEVKRPWYERYQPVSYKLTSRSGNENEFKDMVHRCNKAGVRIYVDAVINHMSGADAGKGTGIGGSSYDTKSLSFPGVPFSSYDFNGGKECPTASGNIERYDDPVQVRNCRLVGLLDLKLGTEYVRNKIAEFMNNLINIGVAGFRVDACKHMWPYDMQMIWNRLNNLNGAYFASGARPYMFQEVIDLGSEPIKSTEYTNLGCVTEFKYGMYVGQAIRKKNSLKNFKNLGQSWGMLPGGDALVFIDNHDNQRGHGAGGFDILTFFEPKFYKMGATFMLAFPYGHPRLMSSYYWQRNVQGGKDKNDWIGPPHNGDYSTKNVQINTDGTCGGGWMCEHRWRQIKNMVGFHNSALQTGMSNWWDNGNNQIAFSRGNKAFFAMNNEGWDMNMRLYTGLPGGHYCDVISGNPSGNGCTGKTINVDGSGMADISIRGNDEDPMVAIHINAKAGSNPDPVTSPPIVDPGTSDGYKRTVVMVKKSTKAGQDLFLRGGVKAPGCTQEASSSPCSIPIRHTSFNGKHYEKYTSWSRGDNFLDWLGAENNQGSYNGKKPDGSPMFWTTNVASSPAFNKINKYGDHYWMIDVYMDCKRTVNGWFEVKAVFNSDWETNIFQSSHCGGSAGASRPYISNNHMALCGKINVFEFEQSKCTIENF